MLAVVLPAKRSLLQEVESLQNTSVSENSKILTKHEKTLPVEDETASFQDFTLTYQK